MHGALQIDDRFLVSRSRLSWADHPMALDGKKIHAYDRHVKTRPQMFVEAM